MATVTAPKRSIFEADHDDYRESFATFLEREVVPHAAEWDDDGKSAARAVHQGRRARLPRDGRARGVRRARRRRLPLQRRPGRGGHAPAASAPRSAGRCCTPTSASPTSSSAATDEQKAALAAGRWPRARRSSPIAMTEPGTGSDLAGDQDEGHPRRRPLRPQRPEDVHHQRRELRPGDRRREDRPGRRRTPACRCSSSTPTRRASARARRSRRSASTPPTPPSSSSTTSRCRPRTCSARRAPGFFQLVEKLVPERLILAVSSIAGCRARCSTRRSTTSRSARRSAARSAASRTRASCWPR